MGAIKEYRQRLKYQISSAKAKTLQALLCSQFRQGLGMSQAESLLLSHKIEEWISAQKSLRAPNQIIVCAFEGVGSFSRKKAGSKEITLSIYDTEDLDIHLEFGIAAMQQNRILRLIEEAYAQGSLLSAKQLSLLLNITPTSLRNRLKKLRSLSLLVPIKGLGKKDRDINAKFRSTWAIEKALSKTPLQEIRQTLAMSRVRFEAIMDSFAHLEDPRAGLLKPQPEELCQWLLLKERPVKKSQKIDKTPKALSWEEFSQVIASDFNFSPVRLRAIKQVTDELLSSISSNRAYGDIIYWATASSTPAGVPLAAARLEPVTLGIYEPEDASDQTTDKDINRLKDIKFKKILRMSLQAKSAGTYLSNADLSYLLGIHCSAISNIIKANPCVVVPLRGNQCDIGRGTTHRKQIIELYLNMHTETEIVSRTGHSYESIENYIKEFATVLNLSERGMPVALIRRITKRSPSLVNAYLELIKKYSSSDYAFRFCHLRKIFDASDFKKKGFML